MADVVTTKSEVRAAVAEARKAGKTIGFVPTMGALHVGHRSLLEQSVRENGFTVLSVFVNPTQFGPAEDFDRYPRQLEKDRALATDAGVDLVFAPTPEEMYAPDQSTWVEEELLSEGLCGARRPNHFRGVATVVTKLLNIVQPDNAYFGRKDYQQYRIVERVVRDLDLPVRVHGVPTVRDEDGLAVSSRNQYLTPEEHRAALAISRSLGMGRDAILSGERSPRAVSDLIRTELVREGSLKIDYIEIVDADNLELVVPLSGRIVIAVAVYCGQTRLIDNIQVDCDSNQA